TGTFLSGRACDDASASPAAAGADKKPQMATPADTNPTPSETSATVRRSLTASTSRSLQDLLAPHDARRSLASACPVIPKYAKPPAPTTATEAASQGHTGRDGASSGAAA